MLPLWLFMNNIFNNDEQLYRAVYPPDKQPNFWKRNGTLSSASLLDSRGLSVDRGNYRSDEKVLSDMASRLTGVAVRLAVGDCKSEKANVCYKPTPKNKYHSEIHGSDREVELSESQRLVLASKAVLVGELTK